MFQERREDFSVHTMQSICIDCHYDLHESLYNFHRVMRNILKNCCLYTSHYRQDFWTKLTGIIYICTITGELNIYCIMSQIVEHESSKFAYSIYETGWYEFLEKDLIQNIQIAMLGAKKPLIINILGMFPLNMESYVKVYFFL